MTKLCRLFKALEFSIIALFSVGTLCTVTVGLASASGDETVYYSTNKFEVTEFDRRMYLRAAPDATDQNIGSRIRNLGALSDLYAMEILMEDASGIALLSHEESDWIANYAVKLETLKRYMQYKVDLQMQGTDWDLEAKELYQAKPESYQIGESVSIRTLLIRVGERSEQDALRLAHQLLAQARQPGVEFEELVRSNTEDKVASVTGGLMENVGRGQTAEPFEIAAFALREVGEFSEPVVSQFGVHLIQLLDYQLPRKKAFEKVKQAIIDELKPVRAAQYREAIQMGARERKPAGFLEHTEALDSLMLRTSDGKLGPDDQLPL